MTTGLRELVGKRFTPDAAAHPALAHLILDIVDAASAGTSIFVAASVPGDLDGSRRWFKDDECKPARTAERPDTPISGPAQKIRDGLAKRAATAATRAQHAQKRIPMTATQQLTTLAMSLAADRSITLAAALKLAATDHPDIAARWRTELTDDAPEASALSLSTAETGHAFEVLVANHQRENRCALRDSVHAVGLRFPSLARNRD